MNDQPVTFGPFEIDPRTQELFRSGRRVHLEPRPTRLLLRLAQNPGKLITREELRELGWPKLPGAAEQSLNTCVHQIRQALADGGPVGVEVETLRGRGYRLSLVPYRANALIARDGTQGPTGRERGRIRAALLAGAALAAALAVSIATPGPPPVSASSDPTGAEQLLDQARYLTEETQDIGAAMALLDSGLVAFPRAGRIHAEKSDLSFMVGDLKAAERGAQKALGLNPNLATAHRTQGGLAMMRSDWSGADRAFAKARRMDPTDTRNLMAHAYLRTVERRFQDAEELVREALRVDPLSANIHQDAGFMYLLMEKYDEASRYCEEVLRFRPGSTWALECLFDSADLLGRTQEAEAWGRVLLEHYGAQRPGPLGTVAVGQAVRTERVNRWTAAVERGANPFGLAVAYAASGRTRQALAALESALTAPHPGVLSLAVDPRLAPLRRYRAFQEMTQRLHLPA